MPDNLETVRKKVDAALAKRRDAAACDSEALRGGDNQRRFAALENSIAAIHKHLGISGEEKADGALTAGAGALGGAMIAGPLGAAAGGALGSAIDSKEKDDAYFSLGAGENVSGSAGFGAPPAKNDDVVNDGDDTDDPKEIFGVQKQAERKDRAQSKEKDTNMADDAKAGAAGSEEKFGDVQARADAVFRASLNCAAPQPMAGESLLGYRRRLARDLQKFSDEWREAPIRNLDSVTLRVAENRIYADAMHAAMNPTVPAGRLQEVKYRDEAGRQITEFRGSWRAAYSPWLGQASVAKFRKPARYE